MKDYSIITPEDIQTAINESPEAVQAALTSDKLTLAITEISDVYGIDAIEDRDSVFREMVLLFILGFITPEELPAELDEALEINDTETSHELAGDVMERVLSVIESISQNPPTTPIATIKPIVMAGLPPKPAAQPAPTPIAQPATPSPATQIPVFGPGRETQNNPRDATPNTPFVIHSNEEVRSNISMDAEARGTVRPVFYKPVVAPKPTDYSSPSTVRVDMGGTNSVNPQAVPKTVNYTVRTPQAKPLKVDPENVVDLKVGLKDLPK